MNIRVEKRFQVLVWDEFVERKTIDFWSRRRIAFRETTGNTLVGTRGNLLGNFTSFDMSKLLSRLIITLSEKNEVHCILDINTIGQQITEYNRAWWDLEMETFESFLLRDDEQEDKWKKFRVNYRKAAWSWSFTYGVVGNRMPPEEKP